MKKMKNNKILQIVKKIYSGFKLMILMPVGRFLKHLYRSVKAGILMALRNPKSFLSQTIAFVFKWWKRFVVGVVLIAIAFYPIIGFMSEEIDDNPDFSGPAVASNQMQSIQTAQALIHREVVTHGWKANLPIVFPSSVLDNMPSFQMGIMDALAAFTGAFPDEKLQRSAEMLAYPGRTWYLNFSSYLKPTKPAQRVYRKAMALLRSYNEDLQSGQLAPLSAEDLSHVIRAMREDLRHSTFKIDEKLAQASDRVIDFGADNVFYKTKGKLYADALLMRDLKRDYVALIDTPEMEVAFNDAIDALTKAYQYNPGIILNGKADGFLVPSHLAVQGFYTMQAVDALKSLQNFLSIGNE